MTKPLTLFAGVLLGFFTVLLLPALLIVFLHYWEAHERDALLSAAMPDAVRCDGGEEGEPNIPESILPASIKPVLEDVPLPGVFEAWIREHLK